MSELKRESLPTTNDRDQAKPQDVIYGRHIEFPGAHIRPWMTGAATASRLRAKQSGQDLFREIDRIVAKSW
jgi:hypothetical protein